MIRLERPQYIHNSANRFRKTNWWSRSIYKKQPARIRKEKNLRRPATGWCSCLHVYMCVYIYSIERKKSGRRLSSSIIEQGNNYEAPNFLFRPPKGRKEKKEDLSKLDAFYFYYIEKTKLTWQHCCHSVHHHPKSPNSKKEEEENSIFIFFQWSRRRRRRIKTYYSDGSSVCQCVCLYGTLWS